MANTRVQQTTLINTNLADNTSGLITPAKDREVELASVAASAFVDDDNDFTGVNVHSKEVRWHKGVNLASATNVALGVTGNYHHITGAVEIETLSTKQHGTRMLLYFVSTPNLVQSANLLLGGADITVVAGSNAEFISEGSGVWRLIKYNNGAISGDWVPQISGGDTNTLVAARYSVQGNVVTFVVEFGLDNGVTVAPILNVQISYPDGLIASSTLANAATTAVWSDRFGTIYTNGYDSFTIENSASEIFMSIDMTNKTVTEFFQLTISGQYTL